MKRRSQRLQVVLDMERRKEQAALEHFQQEQHAMQQQQNRLEELERYQSEYQQQLRQETTGTVAVSRLQAGQQFIEQISTAIARQHRQVEQHRKRCDQARREWQQAWERREGMARYIETCRQREQAEDDRVEQKALDDAASQQYARRTRR